MIGIKKDNIEFIMSCGFAGSEYYIKIQDTYHTVNSIADDCLTNEKLVDKAILIVKQIYGIEMEPEEIKFKWDGTL